MRGILYLFVFAGLACFSKSVPLQRISEENIDPLLIPDIQQLRKLDELVGKAEEAALSQISLDVDNLLPDIEDKLIHHDAVELVDEDPELSVVAEDLRRGSIEDHFSLEALPSDFTRYDRDDDGHITTQELAGATGTSLEDSVQPFETADTNGDGLLTLQEFHGAPWVFDMKQTTV